MTTVELQATDLTVPELAEMARKGTVILTRNGKPQAAVRDLSGKDWESVSLMNNPHFQSLIEESRRSLCEDGSLTIEQVRQELGLAKPRGGRLAKKRKPAEKKA
jgi:hypothetical protein